MPWPEQPEAARWRADGSKVAGTSLFKGSVPLLALLRVQATIIYCRLEVARAPRLARLLDERRPPTTRDSGRRGDGAGGGGRAGA
eukprot:5986316-Prymnesium_polylepis.3